MTMTTKMTRVDDENKKKKKKMMMKEKKIALDGAWLEFFHGTVLYHTK